jgi:hypothetical protein
MLYHVSIFELKESQLDLMPKEYFRKTIEESLINSGQDIWQVLWKMYLEDCKIKLFVYGLDKEKINLIRTICLDESMYSMFNIFEEDDEMDYRQIIDINVKENGYIYKDCLEGEIIENIKDLYVF